MALKLSIQNPYDGIASDAYWKVVETNINFLSKQSHVTMCCWLDADCREDLRQPIDSRSYDWSGDEFPFTWEALNEADNNAVKISYDKIKSLTTIDEHGNEIPGEFAEAVDII